MYGAILGDIAGSLYEFSRPKGFNHKTVKLFDSLSRYTDDSVLSIATKYAVLTGCPYARAYSSFAKRYPNAGYGNMFRNWVMRSSSKGYNSYGNGSAMRVSFIGEHFSTLELVEREAEVSSMCTHNHPEGVKAAVVTAGMIYLARQGESKKELLRYVKSYGYQTCKPLFLYRPFSKFDTSAMGTMPLVIRCFFESDDWESCMRNALSVPCDTDTVGCIAGSIADAFYGKTGFDEIEILKRYLIKPSQNGQFDTYLFDWATKTT
ncbi:ADP-ribosylglycohydrolase family protein [Scatolibacter rhodanostii]|uniref:ADP-ribosylglycohydrolase family protein n=1 Tax=Scatolibacter rhodanostii TaxID=2014781 RepID=UPI000C06BFCC|nr:ADP-ribosylglycohydrolase family protein [Scatolibacter rhodanostii]